MKSMQKLSLRNPIAEYEAEELTSAAALAHDAEIVRANRQQMLESIRAIIRGFEGDNLECQIMGVEPMWSPEAIFFNALREIRRRMEV